MNKLEIIRNGLMQCIEKIDKLAKSVVNLANRATTLEGRASTLEGRASTLEGRASTLEGRASTLEGRAGTLEELLIPLNTFMNATLFQKLGCVLKNNVSGNITTYKDGVVDKPNLTDYILAGCAKSYKCKSSTTNVVLKNLDTSQVTSMEYMFNSCSELTSIDLSNFDTGSVTSMYSMFYSCSKLTSLDLSSFNVKNVINVINMFNNCASLTSIIGTHTLEEVQAGTIKAMKGLKVTLDIPSSPHLERASILALFYGLADLTGKTQQTVTLHATAKARLTAEDIKIATDKNWKVQ